MIEVMTCRKRGSEQLFIRPSTAAAEFSSVRYRACPSFAAFIDFPPVKRAHLPGYSNNAHVVARANTSDLRAKSRRRMKNSRQDDAPRRGRLHQLWLRVLASPKIWDSHSRGNNKQQQ